MGLNPGPRIKYGASFAGETAKEFATTVKNTPTKPPLYAFWVNRSSLAAAVFILSPALSFAAVSLLSPANGATGVSQSPALNAAELLPGASVQYHFQVDTVATMDSQGGGPQGSFDQTVAQLFASSGAFSGQNATISVANDAYSAVSTATFAFYSYTAKLSADTQYYWRARAKPSGGSYGAWSGTAAFTTGRFAAQNPANHTAISGGSLSGPAGAVSIGFTISENNVSTGISPGGGAYNTADWVFVKFSTQAGADGSWNHATLTGGTVGAGATLTAAGDKKGVFLDHTASSAYWTAGTTVTWNSAADGVFSNPVALKVFAVSMVRVPTGSFIYNAGNIGGTGANNIAGPKTITSGSGGDLPSGAPAGWPNGYNSFYIGRYEITQGQYADFLNTVWSSTAAVLYYGGVGAGHNMTYASGNPYGSRYAAVDPNAAKNYLSVSDAWSYLSWAGLRPLTEMEFEKAGRDLAPDARTYPWGDAAPGVVTYTLPNEGGDCIRNHANYGGGCGKVLDAGRYMSGDVYRTAAETGASPWGIADLGGNAWELMSNCSYLNVPANGNGTVDWPANWPAPGAYTFGLRGGSQNDGSTAAVRVSDRANKDWGGTYRHVGVGSRAARMP